MNYVAKVELFERRWQGWILSRLGAFPIRRGESDEDSMETARLVVERGGAVCIFPEGTRIRSGSLATPKRGVGRLALQTGAPVIPAAVLGTEHVRRGWRIRPRKVKVRLGRAMTFPRAEEPSPALAETVTARIWPNVELQWEDLGGLPPMRRAAVIGAGSWGTAVAVLLARGGLEVQLGTRTAEQAAELDRGAARTAATCRGSRCRTRSTCARPREIELAGLDLVCLAIPSELAAAGGRRDRRPGRRPLLDAAADQGPDRAARASCRPSTSASGCAPGRSPASAARPTPARRSPARPRWCSAPPTPTCATSSARSSTAPAWSASAPRDVTGVEMAGAAKNAAALAAAAAEPHGLNAAGIAAAEVWRECIELRDRPRRRARDLLRPGRGRRPDRDDDGARPAATAAPASCSARGTPAAEIPAHDRPGLRGPRRGAAAGRGDRRRRRPGRGARRASRR